MEENHLVEICNPLDDRNQLHNLQQTFSQLLSRNEFVDCTLCCQDGQVAAHRIMLAAGSTYIHNMLSSTPWPSPCSHPVLFFKTSTVEEMKIALKFIYTGKVQLSPSKLPRLMNIARDLECSHLIKAIEDAVQSCGIEIFRRKVQKQQLHKSPPSLQKPRTMAMKPDTKVHSNKTMEPEQGSSCSTPLDQVNDNSDLPSTPKVIKTETEDLEVASMESSFDQSSLPSGLQVNSGSLSDSDENRDASDQNATSSINEITITDTFSHDGTLDDFNTEQSQVEDEEEMPISVVDLKSLAEPDSLKNILFMGHSDNGLEGSITDPQTPANCPWCLQVFTSTTLLQKHIKTHVGTYKPFACPYCSISFARSAHLKRHIRTHTGEKPFVCSVCDKAFSRQDKLKIHLERHLQVQQTTSSSIVNNATQNFRKPNATIPTTTRNFPLSSRQLTVNGIDSRYFEQNSAPEYQQYSMGNNGNSLTWQDQDHNDVSAPKSSSSLMMTITNSSVSPSTTITPVPFTSNNVLTFTN